MADIYNNNSNSLISGTSSDDEIRNFGDSVTINGGAGNDSIGSKGDSVKIDGGDGDDYIFNNKREIWNEETEEYEYLNSKATINGGDGNDYIYNLNGDEASIVGGAGNDTIVNYNGDDSTIAGGKGDDLISLSSFCRNNVIEYKSGDGKDKIYGFRADSTLQIAGGKYSTKKSGDDVIVTVGDGKISLMGAANLKTINIETENDPTLLSLDNNSKSSVTLGAEIVTADATSRTNAIAITGNALDNSITGGSGKDKLYGKDGNDFIDGGTGNDKLYGQNGDDTLFGGLGNDTLKGGAGADLFIYSGGNDVITDYATGDKISLGAAVDNASLSGSDAVLIIGSGKLTVKNRKELTLIDSEGKEFNTIIGSSIFTDDSAAKATLGSGIEVGDASSRTSAIRIVGNALDNSILGGSGKDSLYGADGNDYLFGSEGADKLYGQNGNDTLWGGIGNDTLNGGDGADVFIYESGDGKDVISGFENNDMLLITGAFSASYDAEKNSIAFKVDSTANAITIKDFTATRFNINGINYKISGSKLVEK